MKKSFLLATIWSGLIVLSLPGAGAAGGFDVHDPMFWRAVWLKAYGGRLERVEPGEPRDLGRGRTVLLVPGMTIARDFFAPMAERLVRDGFVPVLYEDKYLLTDGIDPAARRLAAKVEEVRAHSGEDRILILAECVGGVTARYYLQVLGGSDSVERLVTFVSPHHGTAPAPLAARVTGWGGMSDIGPHSALLAGLNAGPLPAGVSVTSIYSCWDVLMWPRRTARIEGAKNIEFCRYYVDHFDGFWDDAVYESIVSALAEG